MSKRRNDSDAYTLDSQQAVADFFGAHLNTVAKWVKRGMPAAPRADGARVYDLRLIAPWVYVNATKGRPSEEDEETAAQAAARKLKADATRSEVKAAQLVGDSVERAEHLRRMWALARTFRDSLRALGDRVARLLPGVAGASAAVDQALEPVLAELAGHQHPEADDGPAGAPSE